MDIGNVSLMNVGSEFSGRQSRSVQSDVNLLPLKQAQNAAKEEGQALVQMIDQASTASTPKGRVDVYA